MRFTLILVALLSGGAVIAQDDAVLENRLRAHIEFLADDLMLGRQPGTPQYDIAARYVASQMRQAGLQPAGEGWMVGWSRRAVICYDIQTGKALGSWPIEASGPVRLSVHGEQAWAAIPGQGVAQLDLTGLCADSD